MEKQNVQLFVHRHGIRPKAVSANADETLASTLRQAEVDFEESLLVFIGEAEEALAEALDVDDGEDVHEPVEPNQPVSAFGSGRSLHVHCHTCRRVSVTVRYGQHTKRHRFSPATTIAVATGWARRKFRLSDADAAKLVLQLCDSSARPRSDEHLGELVKRGECSVCFDLVPDQPKIEG